MPLPPYGRQLVISPQIPIVLIFVGEPDCWRHAQQQLDNNLHNFLCLPGPDHVADYHWPVENCSVIAIIFPDLSADTEAWLMAVLCRYHPEELILRHWPGTDLIIRRRRHGG